MRSLQPVLTLALLLAAQPALAQQQVALEPVRSYVLPRALSLNDAVFSGDTTGRTLIAGTGGVSPAQRCMIVSATDAGASLYSYQYNGAQTACVGVFGTPSGGLLVRASAPELPVTGAPAVTALISPTGELIWQLEDSALVNARSVADGGTGEFEGIWSQAHPGVAYSEARGRALGFTQGELRIGQLSKALTQAHSVGAAQGELLVSGQVFGNDGLGSLASLLVSRKPDNDFLLQVNDTQGEGATFYRYDGRRRIQLIRPQDRTWSDRQVRPMVAAGERLVLLWRPSAGDAGDWRVTMIEESGAQVWEQALGSDAERDGLGEPLGVWASAQHVMVVYLRADGPLVRVLSAGAGETLVPGQSLAGLTPRLTLTLVPGADESLVLLSLDTAGRLYEDRLALVEAPVGEDMGADMGEDMGGEMGVEEPAASDDGCGCAAPGAASAPGWWMLAWLGGGWARRRAAKALARRAGLREDGR
jgi:MYXO-CTERM domain-containing protein